MNSIIKNAFIDAQCDSLLCAEHNFSADFETRMLKLLKQQRGFLRFVNTAGKRVACLALVLTICLTTVLSVDALREPIVKAIEEIYVSVRDKLKGTQAENIAVHFPDNITSIVATNLITETHKVYVIDEPKKINEFINLLAETEWGEPCDEWGSDTEYVQYRFEFKSGKSTATTLNICSNIDGWFGIAEIITNGQATAYNISERTFYDILAFTTHKYYLHQSDLELPSREKCIAWQRDALEGLDFEKAKMLSEKFRKLHSRIEDFLLSNVARLKEPDSIYWGPLLNPRLYVNFSEGIMGDESEYTRILGIFDEIIPLINNKETLQAVKMMKRDFIQSVNNHDLGAVFTVHEYIHDYDYYVINYPPQYDTTPPDWGGVDDYFGRIE